ncbi:hypothetical protein WN55_07813 [Dufourea novaeangliae]|uniref:Uncharacterized protein n=1 Tax=Dufourea novaeangliae TaxID=178035 RepID=A0A154PSR5_DUFNO|nr:hypothetical protein WN55_07813 [Dufourea novaeangliae]
MDRPARLGREYEYYDASPAVDGHSSKESIETGDGSIHRIVSFRLERGGAPAARYAHPSRCILPRERTIASGDDGGGGKFLGVFWQAVYGVGRPGMFGDDGGGGKFLGVFWQAVYGVGLARDEEGGQRERGRGAPAAVVGDKLVSDIMVELKQRKQWEWCIIDDKIRNRSNYAMTLSTPWKQGQPAVKYRYLGYEQKNDSNGSRNRNDAEDDTGTSRTKPENAGSSVAPRPGRGNQPQKRGVSDFWRRHNGPWRFGTASNFYWDSPDPAHLIAIHDRPKCVSVYSLPCGDVNIGNYFTRGNSSQYAAHNIEDCWFIASGLKSSALHSGKTVSVEIESKRRREQQQLEVKRAAPLTENGFVSRKPHPRYLDLRRHGKSSESYLPLSKLGTPLPEKISMYPTTTWYETFESHGNSADSIDTQTRWSSSSSWKPLFADKTTAVSGPDSLTKEIADKNSLPTGPAWTASNNAPSDRSNPTTTEVGHKLKQQ